MGVCYIGFAPGECENKQVEECKYVNVPCEGYKCQPQTQKVCNFVSKTNCHYAHPQPRCKGLPSQKCHSEAAKQCIRVTKQLCTDIPSVTCEKIPSKKCFTVATPPKLTVVPTPCPLTSLPPPTPIVFGPPIPIATGARLFG